MKEVLVENLELREVTQLLDRISLFKNYMTLMAVFIQNQVHGQEFYTIRYLEGNKY